MSQCPFAPSDLSKYMSLDLVERVFVSSSCFRPAFLVKVMLDSCSPQLFAIFLFLHIRLWNQKDALTIFFLRETEDVNNVLIKESLVKHKLMNESLTMLKLQELFA